MKRKFFCADLCAIAIVLCLFAMPAFASDLIPDLAINIAKYCVRARRALAGNRPGQMYHYATLFLMRRFEEQQATGKIEPRLAAVMNAYYKAIALALEHQRADGVRETELSVLVAAEKLRIEVDLQKADIVLRDAMLAYLLPPLKPEKLSIGVVQHEFGNRYSEGTDLLKSYIAFAEAKGLSVQITKGTSEKPEAIAVCGEGATDYFRAESGTHRIFLEEHRKVFTRKVEVIVRDSKGELVAEHGYQQGANVRTYDLRTGAGVDERTGQMFTVPRSLIDHFSINSTIEDNRNWRLEGILSRLEY